MRPIERQDWDEVMGTLYLTQPGSTMRRDGEALRVYVPAQESVPARKVTIPLHKITQVVVMGNVTLTTPVLQTLMDRKVAVTYLTGHGRFVGHLRPPLSRNGRLREAQHAAHNHPVKRMEMAQACVVGKLHNMRVLLLRYNRKLELPEISAAAERLDTTKAHTVAVIPDVHLPEDPQRPQTGSTWGTLMGYEGTGSAAYFRVFGKLLRDGWEFPGRKRRPPTDPVNAMLSFAYTLLYHQVMAAVETVGLDPYVGFLHGMEYGKPAMALDLMEEMRPVIADSVVITIVNKRILGLGDFEEKLGAYRMTDRSRRTFLEQWEARLETEIRHPIFGYKATYRRVLMLQARLAARWILGDIDAYPPFTVR